MPFVLAGRLLHLLGAPLGKEGCEEFVVSFCAPLVMSGIFVALVDVWRRLGADRQSMIRGIWVLGLGSMLWSYANFPSSDAIMAAALLMTLREWLIRRNGRSEWVAGCWLGIALLSRKQASFIAPVIILIWVIWQRNTFLVRNDELRIVLGLDQRPKQFSQHPIQTHRPFQAPNLWWAQIIRELGDRKRPQPDPDRSVR